MTEPPNQALQQTGAALLVPWSSQLPEAAPAAELGRSAAEVPHWEVSDVITRYGTLAALFLLAGGLAAEDDKDRLQGEWTAVSVERNGKAYSDETIKKTKLVLKGDEYLLTFLNNEKFTFRIDLAKNPKEIDLFRAGKDEVVSRGIYKIEDNNLTICRSLTAKVDRPKEFKSGNGVGLSVYRRAEKK